MKGQGKRFIRGLAREGVTLEGKGIVPVGVICGRADKMQSFELKQDAQGLETPRDI